MLTPANLKGRKACALTEAAERARTNSNLEVILLPRGMQQQGSLYVVRRLDRNNSLQRFTGATR